MGNMTENVGVYQINENERFTYTYDTDTPLDYFTGGMYFIQPLLAPWGRPSGYTETLPEIEKAVSRFEESGLTGDRKARAVELYANLLGYSGITKTVRGYSQGDWLDAFIYCPKNDLEFLPRYVAEFENYFRGDVFNVTLERAKVFTAADGEMVTIWQTIDTLGGFITDDQTKLNEYALETFQK